MNTANHQFPDSLGYTPTVEADVRSALTEDIGSGDLTAALVAESQQAKAMVITREGTVLCGRAWFDEVFRQLDSSVKVEWFADEGERVSADTKLCVITGPARAILSGERSALNFLQFLSAVASCAAEYAEAVAHTNTKILDTRKTIPGFDSLKNTLSLSVARQTIGSVCTMLF